MPGEMHMRGTVRREEGGYRRHGEKQPEGHRHREGGEDPDVQDDGVQLEGSGPNLQR